jgi:hypothetical protein
MKVLCFLLCAALCLPGFAERQRLETYPWAKSKRNQQQTKKKKKKTKAKKGRGKKKAEADVPATESPPRATANAPQGSVREPSAYSKAQAAPNPFPGSIPVVAATAPGLPSRSGRYLREFESGFGQFVLGAPAVAFNAQMRFLLSPRRSLYVGADHTFALFASGYYFSLLPGAWYNFTLVSGPLATLSLGVLAGPAFTQGLAGIPGVALTAFGEASISFEIDDLATVRGQFRPGVVGGRLAFSMALLIGFRFR